jgi:hypothetical protein
LGRTTVAALGVTDVLVVDWPGAALTGGFGSVPACAISDEARKRAAVAAPKLKCLWDLRIERLRTRTGRTRSRGYGTAER